MAWILTRGLATVRSEFDATFPGRDKTSDGSVGDLAHQESKSGHNPDRTGNAEYRDGDSLDEVRAIDVDRDLRSSVTMEQVVQYLVIRARSGVYVPFRYIIFNRRIWSRSDGWTTHTYTGANPHDKHAHFSGDYTQTADGWTGSLGLSALTGEGSMLVQKGDSGEQVKFWQYILKDLGHDPGEIDGDYGPKTEAAQNAFRAAHGGGPTTVITGWAGYVMLRTMMENRDAKNVKTGPAGPAGAPGKDGRDGTFTGTLSVTGGTLSAVAVEG